MENKKLINILLKDMNELEGLISDLKESGECDPLELEIIHSKAKWINHLLGIFKDRAEEIGVEKNQDVSEKQDVIQESRLVAIEEKEIPPVEIEAESETQPMVHTEPEEEQEEEAEHEETELLDEETEQEEEVTLNEPETENIESEYENTPPENEEEIQKNKPEEAEKEIIKEVVDFQEPEEEEAARVLGDKFQTGKSVNDLISESARVDQKFTALPLKSIKSAIGINDRFLFTRELFEGNADLFTQSVEKLDKLNNINEAVVFLRENFKWKKNETSLKFIELVKRRFRNE
ncbi:MAG: hypothetical protein JW833_10895 [Prolixibacteraceae bacterium]|nr:hypothetical protein [Prolixibacteraceae bacterium]